MLFCLGGMVPPKMYKNKKRSVFEREKLQKLDFHTYLFDNYNKHAIYLLNFRLDLSWLGLLKIIGSCYLVPWISCRNNCPQGKLPRVGLGLGLEVWLGRNFLRG